MSYTIETGIPIAPKRYPSSYPPNRGPQTEWTKTLDALQPGQSVLTEDIKEFKTADNWTQRQVGRVYAIRKIPREGWRVWRIS